MRSTSQPTSASFATGSQDRVEYKILISQEVLNEWFLATKLMFICTEHLPHMIERMCIQAALQLTHNNRASAAEMLGLSRQSLYVKLRRYDMASSGEAE